MTTREEFLASAERHTGIIRDMLRVYADHPEYTQSQAFMAVCHLRRDDGKTPRCYFDHGDDVLLREQVASSDVALTARTDRARHQPDSPFWSQLAAARDAKILAEAGPNPGPEYVLVADNNGRYSYQSPHRAHKRLKGLSARYRACQECGDSLLAWMAARSGNVHIQQRAADYIKANNVPGYEWLLARYYPEAS